MPRWVTWCGQSGMTMRAIRGMAAFYAASLLPARIIIGGCPGFLGFPDFRFTEKVPDFFIKFLTRPGNLVLDPFAGSNVVGCVAEELGRRWVSVEISQEYVVGRASWCDGPFGRFWLPHAARPVVCCDPQEIDRGTGSSCGEVVDEADACWC